MLFLIWRRGIGTWKGLIILKIISEIMLSKVSLLQIKNYFLSMTSFCCLQVIFIRCCGKFSPHKCCYQKILFFLTLRLLEERVMASPEPSRRPFTSESTTLLSTEMWANTTCHIFGKKFCLPPQN